MVRNRHPVVSSWTIVHGGAAPQCGNRLSISGRTLHYGRVRRLIGEDTHLPQLTHACQEESGDPANLLALDWDKALDRVNWTGIGHAFCHIAHSAGLV
eukprot:scaffold244685_cov27-Tisochrysis_lutea.AAC.1